MQCDMQAMRVSVSELRPHFTMVCQATCVLNSQEGRELRNL